MRTVVDNIECGWHSDIPLCCITWFITIWRWTFKLAAQPGPFQGTAYTFIIEYGNWRGGDERFPKSAGPHEARGYLECPKCKLLRKAARKTYRCPPGTCRERR